MRLYNIPLTIPNVLSLYRLASFPVLLMFILLGWEKAFAYFIWISLTTDILDGWLARRLNQVTETGARLDGLADTATYLLGFTGIIVFKWSDFQPFAVSFSIFTGLFILSRLYSWVKHGRFYGFQTYSGKTAGYIHGSFIIVLFVFGFYTWFYYVMVISGFIVFSENVIIALLLREPRSHVKGLYWVIMERKKGIA